MAKHPGENKKKNMEKKELWRIKQKSPSKKSKRARKKKKKKKEEKRKT